MFAVKRCPRLGGRGSLTKIVTFGTKYFVRYSRHARYLGCPLLRGFTVVLGAQLVICIAKNTLGWYERRTIIKKKEIDGIFYLSLLLLPYRYAHEDKGWVTYRFLYAKRHNDARVWGPITDDVLKFIKTIEFQSSWIVMNCQWIVYSYTKSAKFMSSNSPYKQLNSQKKSSFCSL